MKPSSFAHIGRFALQWAVFGLSAAVMVVIVSIVYATASWGSLPSVNSWSGLTATAWNDLVTHVNQSVKQTSPVITVSGSSVGIGTVGPTATLDVNGKIRGSATYAGTQFAHPATIATTSVTAINIPASAATLAVQNGDIVRVDLSCNLKIDTTGALVYMYPGITSGAGWWVVPITIAMSAVNVNVSNATSNNIWRATADGNVTFQAYWYVSGGTASAYYCSLIATVIGK